MLRSLYFFAFLLFAFSCTKKIGKDIPPPTTTPVSIPIPVQCQIKTGDTVSFSATIFPLINSHCNSCHSSPGAGGINLDAYTSIKSAAQAGNILPVVVNTDTNSIIMPPPPATHLDSCEIKALTIWISQGCRNN